MKKILMVDIYENESNVGDPDGKYIFLQKFVVDKDKQQKMYIYNM